MNDIQNKFLKAIYLSFIAYNKKGGARSNKKLIPIHKFLAETISKKLEKGYSIKSWRWQRSYGKWKILSQRS